MRAEILSYSRSRGLFAGISLEGSTLRPDDDASADVYGRKITAREIVLGNKIAVPASGRHPRSRFAEERATQRIRKGFEPIVTAAELRFLLILPNLDLEKRSSAKFITPPRLLGPSAKLVENRSEFGWVALYPLWGKAMGLADIFRITIPDFHDE